LLPLFYYASFPTRDSAPSIQFPRSTVLLKSLSIQLWPLHLATTSSCFFFWLSPYPSPNLRLSLGSGADLVFPPSLPMKFFFCDLNPSPDHHSRLAPPPCLTCPLNLASRRYPTCTCQRTSSPRCSLPFSTPPALISFRSPLCKTSLPWRPVLPTRLADPCLASPIPGRLFPLGCVRDFLLAFRFIFFGVFVLNEACIPWLTACGSVVVSSFPFPGTFLPAVHAQAGIPSPVRK